MFQKNGAAIWYAVSGCIAVAVVLVLVAGTPAVPASVSAPADVDALCTNFLQTLGYETGGCIEADETVIPAATDPTFEAYNELQKQAGFDLKPLRGYKLERYTYSVDNFEGGIEGVRANFLIYDGGIVGGDICTVALDGFMVPLLRRDDIANLNF